MPPYWEEPGRGWVRVTTEYFRDYWELGYDNSGQHYTKYLGSYRYNVSTEYVYIPPRGPAPGLGDYDGNDTYHQHGNAPHGPTVTQNPHDNEEELDEEPMQIINELEGKADCVYQKMVDSEGNINWILENFEDGEKPSEFDLIFQMSTTQGNETNASMATPNQSGIPNTFVISINKYRAENINTTLTIARTLIHEAIHARLWEFAYRNGKTVSSTDFPGVYEYMREYGKNWDHQQMAAFYRSTIARGLKEFDNGQHSDEFYDALAWEGLSEIKNLNGNSSRIYTEAWKNEPNKTEILNIIKGHKENGTKNCD